MIAAWVDHLRGAGAPVKDAAAEQVVALADGPLEDAVPAILNLLDPELAADTDVVAAVLNLSQQLSAG